MSYPNESMYNKYECKLKSKGYRQYKEKQSLIYHNKVIISTSNESHSKNQVTEKRLATSSS